MIRQSAEPVVSVVMAVRNGERHLRAALDSLLRQTMADFELVVIDDGSTDATASILCQYAEEDDRLLMVRNARNVGLARSLNRALKWARGRYIARQDADDVSAPDRLDRQAAWLDAHPDVGLLGTAYHVIDDAGRRSVIHRPPQTDAEIRWQMMFHNAFCHSSVMFRRSLLAIEPGYNADFPVAQDYDFWARLLPHTRAANLDEPLVEYRVHPAHTGAGRRSEQQEAATRIARRLLAQRLGGEPPDAGDVAELRRWYNRFPRTFRESDRSRVALLARSVKAFAAGGDVAADDARRVVERWVRRIRDAIPAGEEDRWLPAGLPAGAVVSCV